MTCNGHLLLFLCHIVSAGCLPCLSVGFPPYLSIGCPPPVRYLADSDLRACAFGTQYFSV